MALQAIESVGSDGKRKKMLNIDHAAELVARKMFLDQFSDMVNFAGEESLNNFSGWDGSRYCVLADMIDGTDLFEMGIDLWCAAIIIFDRERLDIIGSVVGLPSGHVFYAQSGEEGAKVRFGIEDYDLSGCSRQNTLLDSRICFYGQKLDRLLTLSKSKDLAEAFSKMNERLKIYNFAGNPMMVKMANRPKGDDGFEVSGDIDAVFELKGQYIHDLAPGAYIAKKAGAYFCHVDGEEIEFSDLVKMLEKPTEKTKYILAATKELAMEMSALFY